MRLSFYLIFVLIFTLFFSCSKTEVQNSDAKLQEDKNETKIVFDFIEYDFGTIKQGDKVNKYFKFKNVGTKPFIINEVTTSCGCTSPKFPKHPVAPNESDSILLEYNSSGHAGIISKKATILGNISENRVLTLSGKIN